MKVETLQHLTISFENRAFGLPLLPDSNLLFLSKAGAKYFFHVWIFRSAMLQQDAWHRYRDNRGTMHKRSTLSHGT